MSVALLAGALAATGVFLLLRRGTLRMIAGFILLGHTVNVLLLAAGGLRRRDPAYGVGDPQRDVDPLPQAFVLTAIVISFGITILLLTLLAAGGADHDGGDPRGAGGNPRPAGGGDPRGAGGDERGGDGDGTVRAPGERA